MLKRWICQYTQYENQIDVYNEIVSNGLHPDSSSWDLRKTFELMKDPRVKKSEDIEMVIWKNKKIWHFVQKSYLFEIVVVLQAR